MSPNGVFGSYFLCYLNHTNPRFKMNTQVIPDDEIQIPESRLKLDWHQLLFVEERPKFFPLFVKLFLNFTPEWFSWRFESPIHWCTIRDQWTQLLFLHPNNLLKDRECCVRSPVTINWMIILRDFILKGYTLFGQNPHRASSEDISAQTYQAPVSGLTSIIRSYIRNFGMIRSICWLSKAFHVVKLL